MYKEEYINNFNSSNRELLEEILDDYSPDIDYPLEDINNTVEFYLNALM